MFNSAPFNSLLFNGRVSKTDTGFLERTLAYSIRTTHDITIGLDYAVVSSQALVKTLEYAVLIQAQGISKGLTYAVLTSTALQLSLTYALRLYPYCPKTTPFSAKTGIYTDNPGHYSQPSSPYTGKDSPMNKLPNKC